MSVIRLTLAPTFTLTMTLVFSEATLVMSTASDAMVLELATIARGPAGPAGPGVPTGGTTGQLLAKASDTNYDDEWVDPPNSAEWGGITGDITDQADLQAQFANFAAFAARHG